MGSSAVTQSSGVFCRFEGLGAGVLGAGFDEGFFWFDRDGISCSCRSGTGAIVYSLDPALIKLMIIHGAPRPMDEGGYAQTQRSVRLLRALSPSRSSMSRRLFGFGDARFQRLHQVDD